MFRKTTVVAALALMLVAPQAHAGAGEWQIGLNAGTGIPIGDFKDAAKLGFLGGVGFGYGVSENLVLGVDGSFVANSGSDLLNDGLTALATADGPDGIPGNGDDGTPTTVTGKFQMIQGGAHMKYMFPMAAESSVSPYVIVGAGIYNQKFKTESTAPFYVGDVSESKFGGRGGLGLSYKTSETVGIGVEGAFHYINTDVVSTQYVSFQAGVTINMSTPK
jgi:outer membrane protein W